MKTLLRILVPLLLIGGAYGLAKFMILNKEKPPKRPAPVSRTFVKAIRLQPQDYQVMVRSQGTVKARTASRLLPQVSGEIVYVSEKFQEGGFFEKDEVLLQIDKTDYQTAVTLAEASLAQAEVRVAEEEARAAQAIIDWNKIGATGTPSPLVLRVPQKKQATAALAAATAQREKARRDLERTTIRAPYAGRIMEKSSDLGQVVSQGTTLAHIYAIDYAEVALPVNDRHLAFLRVQEVYRGEPSGNTAARRTAPKVHLTSTEGGKHYRYDGRIVRTSGAVDTRSQQLAVVAQVDNPYGRRADNQPPLKVGAFVTAEIEGSILKNKLVIPRVALREGRDVLLIDDANKLVRTPVKILWGDENNVVLEDGIAPGSLLCVTPVTYAVTGAAVVPNIEGAGVRDLNPPPQQPQGKGKNKRKGKTAEAPKA